MLPIKLEKYKYCMHSYSPNVLLLIVLWKIEFRFRCITQISCRLNHNGTHCCIYSYNGMRLYLIGQHKTRSTTLGRTLPQKYPGWRNTVMNACDWLLCKLRPTILIIFYKTEFQVPMKNLWIQIFLFKQFVIFYQF